MTTITERPVSAYQTWLLEQSWAAPYPTTGITFTDFFCGFGGSSIGLTEAGLQLVWAANHWGLAIENHAANFRQADHYQGDISGYDMRRVPKADVAWLSPECTWHSPAGGRKRVRAQLDALFPDEHVSTDAGERSRATMWDVVRAAEAKAFKIVIVENVVEVTSWPLFDAWLHAMQILGYEHQIVCVTAAHIGDDLNPHAPQWRDRIYFVFYKREIPFPVIEPRPLAWCPQCAAVVESRQSWKREDRRRIGKFGPQYVYVCAANRHPTFVVEPFVLPASAAIDWSDLGTRIGDREKPLAAATMRRIEAGIRMFARPVVAAAAGQTYDAASAGQPRKFYRVAPADGAPLDPRMTTGGDGFATPPFVANVRHGADDHGRQFLPEERPLSTAQTKIGEGLVTPPMIVAGYDYSGGDERRVKAADAAPLHTVVANGRGHHQLVVPPFVSMLRANGKPVVAEDDALATLTTARNHGLVVPEGAFIQKHHGGVDYAGVQHMVKGVDEPLPAIVARPNTSLVIPYRRGRASQADAGPLPTMTTSNTTALVHPAFEDAELREIILNSRFRMLGPLEHGRAQRFPDSYAVAGNKGDRTKGFGNAVASNVAQWLGRFCVVALSGHVERSERAA
jgi:DNA (cytosine-5)-methyltransferase 1